MAVAGEMYLDSAILVKLLVREPDSLYFNEKLSGQVLDTSELSLTEVSSALLAKERTGSISLRERNMALNRLQDLIDEDVIEMLPLDRKVLERAAAILRACHPRVPLRTLDALHVATCDLYRCGTLCATDKRIRDAGAQFAMRVLPESLEEIES